MKPNIDRLSSLKNTAVDDSQPPEKIRTLGVCIGASTVSIVRLEQEQGIDLENRKKIKTRP